MDRALRCAAAALAAALALRFAWAAAVLARACSGGPWPVPLFFAAAAALCLGPGLFFRRVFRFGAGGPALAGACALASGVGTTVTLSWLALAAGVWTRGAAMLLVAASAAAGAWAAAPAVRHGARTLARVRAAWNRTPPSELLAVAVALAAGELFFELVAGTPMQGWDASLSWDAWAAALAERRSLGGCVFGSYPQGLPLFGSVFYKLFPPAAGVPVPASTAHLLLHGLHAGLFPLLLLLAVAALSRSVGFDPLVGQALVLSDFFLVQSMLKQVGDADVPATALCAAALAAVLSAAAAKPGPRLASAATVFAVFGALFSKGTVLPFAFVLAFAARSAGGPSRRDAVRSVWLALALCVPFFLHQWFFALFPECADRSPFFVSLPLRAAHVDLFRPGAAHALRWILKTGPVLGLGGGDAVSAVAAFAAVALPVAALFDRRARSVAAGALAMGALWFFTASYDWRNAFPAHMLACLAAAAVLDRAASRPRRPALRAAARLAVLGGALLLASRQRIPALALRLLHRPAAPAVLAVPDAERAAAVSELGAAHALFARVPFLRDAAHVVVPGREFRLLPNGVRGLPYAGASTFSDPRPGDLAFAARNRFVPPPAYEPVARCTAKELGETLRLLGGVRADVPFRWIPAAAGGGRLELDAAPPSGFVELELDRDAPPDLAVRADRGGAADPAAAAFDGLFPAWTGGRTVRFAFWFPDGPAGRPAFALSSSVPVRCVSARLLSVPDARSLP